MARIRGTSARDRLNGTSAADTIEGLGNNDTLFGNAGKDTMDGGAGDDIIKGGLGNDKLTGGTGNDKLYGEGGSDTLLHGAGADRFDGGTGADTVSYAAVTGGIGVSLDLGNAAPATGVAAGDTYFSVENVIGTAFADIIRGTSGNNTLAGGAGIDQLYDGAGSDSLSGGAGDDFLNASGDGVGDVFSGGDGSDTLSYTTAAIGVIVNFETGVNGGAAANDVLVSIEYITGSDTGADSLTVNKGGKASAAGGDDFLSGSTSTSGFNHLTVEILEGGLGADTFALHRGTGYDVILDFFFSEGDKLQVSTASFAGATTANIRNVSNGVIDSSVAAPQFIFDTITKNLYFDADGTGSSSGPELIALLVAVAPSLVDLDFNFVA